MVVVMTRRSPRCSPSSVRAQRRAFRSRCARARRREALLPVLDQLAARALGADEGLQLGLQAGGRGGVFAGDVGKKTPGAVEEADAISEWDAAVFELLVDREDGLQALRAASSPPSRKGSRRRSGRGPR